MSDYASEAHRLAHPYQDATSDYLRDEPTALNFLQDLQAREIVAHRQIRLSYAMEWLSYCESNNAPEAVCKLAQQIVAGCESKLAPAVK